MKCESCDERVFTGEVRCLGHELAWRKNRITELEAKNEYLTDVLGWTVAQNTIIELKKEIDSLVAKDRNLFENDRTVMQKEIDYQAEQLTAKDEEIARLKKVILLAPGSDEKGFAETYRKWWDAYHREIRTPGCNLLTIEQALEGKD